jgi:hypothetical protein
MKWKVCYYNPMKLNTCVCTLNKLTHTHTHTHTETHTHTHTHTRVNLTLQKDQSVYDSKLFFCNPSVTKRQMELLPANSEVLTAKLDYGSSLGGCYTVSTGINSYRLFVDNSG